MIWKETTNKEMPTIILLHGGGLSAWSLQEVVKQLQGQFHVVTPILDGHGENADEEFKSISDCADKVIAYIDKELNGKVYAIGGLSIGAQIVTEVLSQRMDITEHAILESALVYPLKKAVTMALAVLEFSYGLIQKRWFAKLQAKELFVPPKLFEQYYQDSIKISRQSLLQITRSNASFHLKEEIANTKASVLIIVGEKEIKIMKKSARLLHDTIRGSKLYMVPGMKHGELSLAHPVEYVTQIKEFLKESR